MFLCERLSMIITFYINTNQCYWYYITYKGKFSNLWKNDDVIWNNHIRVFHNIMKNDAYNKYEQKKMMTNMEWQKPIIIYLLFIYLVVFTSICLSDTRLTFIKEDDIIHIRSYYPCNSFMLMMMIMMMIMIMLPLIMLLISIM